MLRQLLVGAGVSACNIVIHALIMTAVVCVAPAEADAIYFAFVNDTTLGYGDVTPVARVAAARADDTAMNGVLLFGWSTAVIFEILQRAMGGDIVAAAGPSKGLEGARHA